MIKLSILTPVWNQVELVIKELENLPRRDDVEVLVRDDGSTDGTLEALEKYKEEHPELNLTIFSNGSNKGVAYTKNRLLESMNGEYFHIHDSDDYVFTEDYEEVIEELYKTRADIVCFDLEINDGRIFHIGEGTRQGFCAQIGRFIRKDFVDKYSIRFPEKIRARDDLYFNDDCIRCGAVHLYTNIIAYHYNFPREGSLYDLQVKGLIRNEH